MANVGCFAAKKAGADTKQTIAMDGKLTMFLSGDALISLPWSYHDEPEFLGLIDEIRNADVAITNLEMLLHDYKGFVQAENGTLDTINLLPIALRTDRYGCRIHQGEEYRNHQDEMITYYCMVPAARFGAFKK